MKIKVNKHVELFINEKTKINDKIISFSKIKEKDAAVVLLFKRKKNKIYLLIEYQYRPVIKKYIYEAIAGHIEDNEDVVSGAEREIREETGYIVKLNKPVLYAYSAPGISTQREFFFIKEIKNEKKRNKELDKDEIIKLKWISLEKAIDMIRKNKIKDAKTIILIFYLYYKIKDLI